MFFSKLALYGTIAGTFFTVSAFSTVGISRIINKVPVPNENESSEEEEEETYTPRAMSDSEKFIKEITGFGNLNGNLDLTVTKGEYTLNVNGDVFVSLESMDKPMVDADLDFTILNKTFNVKATYLEGTAYLTLEGNNLKLNTNDINEFTSLFSVAESSIELPESFKNIDSNKLLANLGAMTSVKDEEKITYTCNLIEGIPPIIFTTDLKYKMTSVSISNFEIEGFTINAFATTEILGAGHNKVVNPETEENPYTDVTSYIGTIKQIQNLINSKEAGLTYNVSIAKGDNNLLSTSGTANVSLANGLDLVIDGTLYNSDKSKSVTYFSGYQDNNVFVNFNDLIKIYYDVNHFDDLKSSIETLLNDEMIAKLMSNMEEINLPIIKMVNEGDINGLIDLYQGIFISKDQIKLSLPNSMFGESNTNFDIVINLNNEGITDLNISNLRYEDYSLSLALELKEYKKTTVDLTEYDNVSNVDKLISQVNNLIHTDKANIIIDNISYGDYSVSGYVQFDLTNKLYQADMTLAIQDEDNVKQYNIKLENDGVNCYLRFNDGTNNLNLVLSEASINDVITSIKNFVNVNNEEINKLISKVTEKFNNTKFNALDIIFEDYLKSFDIVKDELNNEDINITINGAKLGLESDINLTLGLNKNVNLSRVNGNLDIKGENLEFNVKLAEFNANLHAIPLEDRLQNELVEGLNQGGWVGVSNVSNVVNYVTSLPLETSKAVVSQVKDLIENKEVGATYSVKVTKNSSSNNKLIFDMNGRLDLSLSDLSNIDAMKVNLEGNLINNDNSLNSPISFKLYEGALYFDYKNQLKFSYEVNDIKSLVSIIKSKLTSTSENDISGVLNKLFPSSDSTKTSPIVNIIKNESYFDILNYYKEAYKDGSKLYLVFDGALIGNDENEITLSVDINDNGINNISINGVYALGYTLDFSINLDAYHDFEVTENEKNGYTNLKYFNNIFEQIADLIDAKKFNISLNGNVNLGKGVIGLSGSSKVSLGEEEDIGIANLTITDTNNNPHNISLDVNRKKTGENPLDKSNVSFIYNKNLKGTFTLGSLNETFNYIKTLSSTDNQLLDKIKTLLTKDNSNSTINKIMNGEPEAILYDNTLKAITHDGNPDGIHYYDIEINGNFLKSDVNDVVKDLHILINMKANKFTGITINGGLNDYSLNISLGIAKEETDVSSWDRVIADNSFFDFSDMKTLVNYLFNTGTKKDFTMSGFVNINALDLFDVGNLSLSASVHIDKDNNTISKVVIDNIPHIIAISDDSWDYRRFTMYITDDYAYLHVYYTNKPFLSSRTYKNKWIKLTMKDFTSDIAYYLVNYGMGITTNGGLLIGNKLDMRNQTSSDEPINFANVLSSYQSYSEYTLQREDSKGKKYDVCTGPAWKLDINLAELAHSSALDVLHTTIVGNKDTGLLHSIVADTTLASIVNANFYADLTSTEKLNDDLIESINSFISNRNEDELGKAYSNKKQNIG